MVVQHNSFMCTNEPISRQNTFSQSASAHPVTALSRKGIHGRMGVAETTLVAIIAVATCNLVASYSDGFLDFNSFAGSAYTVRCVGRSSKSCGYVPSLHI